MNYKFHFNFLVSVIASFVVLRMLLHKGFTPLQAGFIIMLVLFACFIILSLFTEAAATILSHKKNNRYGKEKI